MDSFIFYILIGYFLYFSIPLLFRRRYGRIILSLMMLLAITIFTLIILAPYNGWKAVFNKNHYDSFKKIEITLDE